MKDISTISKNCTRFLNGHGPRSVREHLECIAASPLSLMSGDHYGKGGFIAEFEVELAELLGKEAAVFMPSGTMAQPIALRIWSDLSGSKNIAFHPTCHLELHEQGAYRHLHSLNAILLGEPNRLFTLDDFQKIDEEISTLLIELPQREIGGQLPSWAELLAICDAARARDIRLHMDGARLWECGPYYNRSYAEICAPFDSVYASFYKILGGLPGAVLAGPASMIAEARIWQRRQGGNLQQQSAAAISAKLGMEQHLPKMPQYVAKAAEIARVLRKFEGVKVVPENPPTNMMHLHFSGDPERLVEAAIQIAEEDKVALFFRLTPGGKIELSVSAGALQLSVAEIEALFTKLFKHAVE